MTYVNLYTSSVYHESQPTTHAVCGIKRRNNLGNIRLATDIGIYGDMFLGILPGIKWAAVWISGQDFILVVSEYKIDLVAGLRHVIVAKYRDNNGRDKHDDSERDDGGSLPLG